MSSEIATTGQPAGDEDAFEASLAAERSAERSVMRSVAKMIVVSIPIGIAFFIGLLAVAIGGDVSWWVVVGLGSLLGLIGAGLFGMLAGVVLHSETLDAVDHDVDVAHGGAAEVH
ncbi:MAG: hypothetical protein ABW073_01635 [Acidimicrobiia bacterium]